MHFIRISPNTFILIFTVCQYFVVRSDMDLVVLGDWDFDVDPMYCKRVLRCLKGKLWISPEATNVLFIPRARGVLS